VPVGQPSGCPAPRAISGDSCRPSSHPVLQLWNFGSHLAIARLRFLRIAANVLPQLGKQTGAEFRVGGTGGGGGLEGEELKAV
jgi:hypothetical protein